MPAPGGVYTAETNSGTVTFGENLWKLSEEKYIIRAPELTIRFADGDERPAGEYVQVTTTPDGIVQLLTVENLWTTISSECCIQTQGGIKVYPVTQLVDNGVNKLSLAKISVSADDSIVLTESETRRQIVPELNIEAVDGEDGADGDAGQDGEQGEAGEKGADGEEGAAGAAGAAGAMGAGGKNGSAGALGWDGQAGNSATIQSSTNVALPVMSFTNWEVTATGLKGTISVTDESDLLDLGGTNTDNYKPTVTIYEVDTGRKIACVGAKNGAGEYEEIAFGGDETDFVAVSDNGKEEPLIPDTNYRISVVAYYKMSDMIYSREFISRFFYTDSTGLLLEYVGAATNGFTVNAKVAEGYQKAIRNAKIYLLTPEQNLGFNIATENHIAYYVLDYETKQVNYHQKGGETISVPLPADAGDAYIYNLPLNFGASVTDGNGKSGAPLKSNQRYVLRVKVDIGAGEMLTNQTLEARTLREEPTWDKREPPKADFNRVTGAFEVYRPVVADNDGGVTRYIYTAMQYDEVTKDWVAIPGAQKTGLPSETGPATFFLPADADYRFKVEMEFNDNEKTVAYDLGTSEQIRSKGGSLPRVSWEAIAHSYNEATGNLVIDIGSNYGTVTIDQDHRMQVHRGQRRHQDPGDHRPENASPPARRPHTGRDCRAHPERGGQGLRRHIRQLPPGRRRRGLPSGRQLR